MKWHKNIEENVRESKEYDPIEITVILSDATKCQWRTAGFRYIVSNGGGEIVNGTCMWTYLNIMLQVGSMLLWQLRAPVTVRPHCLDIERRSGHQFLSRTKTTQHEHCLENAANFSKWYFPYSEGGEGRIFPKLSWGTKGPSNQGLRASGLKGSEPKC